MRPSGAPAQISGANPVAEGLGRIGQGMVTLSNEQRERDDALQAAEADAHLTTGLAALRRRFEQDGDWQTFEPRFQAEASRIRAEASSLIRSPVLLRRWQPRADVTVSGSLENVLGRGRRLQSESEYDRMDTVLSSLSDEYNKASDDAGRDTIMRRIEENLELAQRRAIVQPERLRELRRRHLQGAIEGDVNSRVQAGDGYAALLELREGDPRGRTPSAGQVSDPGLTNIRRLLERRGLTTPGESPEQATRRLRTEGSQLSRWMTENLVGDDGQPLRLTQLQHDALAAFALSRPRSPGEKPEDALSDLVPVIRSGDWESVASAIRAGSLTSLEQPAPGGAAPAPGGPRVGGPVQRFAPDVDSAIASAAQAHGIDPDLLRRVAAIESAGNPRAVTGSYRGLFQLSAAEFGGRGDIFSAEDNANAAAANFVRHIADFRRQNGRDPTAGELYLIHQQGAGGFAAHMAQPGRLAWESMFSTAEGQQRGRAWARQAIAGNLPPAVLARFGGVDNVTSQQFMDYWRSRVEGTSGSPAPSSAPGAPASADSHLSTIADMVLGQAPSSRYARLPPDRRRVVMDRAAEAVRGDATDGLNSDIESITRTGRPRPLPDGTTWLERARRARIFTPMQLAGFERRVRRAEARFRAISGMSDETPEQIDERIAGLDTSRVGEGEDYALAAEVRQGAVRDRERLLTLRRTDPGRWASGTYILGERRAPQFNARGEVVTAPAEDDIRVDPPREVSEAYRTLARRYPHMQIEYNEQDGTFTATAEPVPGQISPEQARPQSLRLTDPRLTADDRRLILEARLAAMARVRIPEHEQRFLSSAEARELLGLPTSLTGIDPSRYDQLLRQAADRAATMFGPRYARRAFETALSFQQMNPDQRREAQGVSGSLPGGGRDALTPAESARLAREMQLSREEAMWRYGTPSIPLPGVGEGLPFGPLMGITAPPTPRPGWFGSAPTPDVPSVSSGVSEWPMVLPPSLQGSPMSPPPSIPPRVEGTSASGVNLQGWPRPSPDLIARLARAPHMQAEFDRTFGPGAAAHYLTLSRQSRTQR